MMVQIEVILDSDSHFEIDFHRLEQGKFFAHDFVRNLFHPEGRERIAEIRVSILFYITCQLV